MKYSPFFPPHIGAEPGLAKWESRITCMRMLRTNQSKITRSQPYYAARVNVSRNAIFSSRSSRALKKTLFFDVDIVVGNKSICGLSWSVLSSTTSTRHNSFPKHFLHCFYMLSGEFAKVFERKVWRLQVANLHNAARALSSPCRCFQLSTNLDKDFCRYLWYCSKKNKSNVV